MLASVQGALSPAAVTASEASPDSAASGEEAQRPAFLATESVMQQRTYFGGVMVAYVLGLAVAFAVRAARPCFPLRSHHGTSKALRVTVCTSLSTHISPVRPSGRRFPQSACHAKSMFIR